MAQTLAPVDLGKIWLFSACTSSHLRTIRRQLDEVAVPPGKILCDEGEIGREFFVIVDGLASVRRKGRKVATLGPGDYFGELSLLDRKGRTARVTSETDMTLLVLGQREFNGLLSSIPGLAHRLLTAMAARLREADAKAIG
jgi:CRP-like cAMP-binding protein